MLLCSKGNCLPSNPTTDRDPVGTQTAGSNQAIDVGPSSAHIAGGDLPTSQAVTQAPAVSQPVAQVTGGVPVDGADQATADSQQTPQLQGVVSTSDSQLTAPLQDVVSAADSQHTPPVQGVVSGDGSQQPPQDVVSAAADSLQKPLQDVSAADGGGPDLAADETV